MTSRDASGPVEERGTRTGEGAGSSRAPAAQPGRGVRARAALTVMMAALALLALGAPTWFSGRLPGPVQGEVDVAVSGAEAVGALGGIALVLLAAGVALGLAGRVGRRVVGVLVAVSGGTVALLVSLALREPGETLRGQAASSTGVSGVPEHVVVSPLASATIVLAVLVVALGAWHSAGRGRWPAPGARHDRDARPDDASFDDPARAWDALSDGADPS